VRWCFRRRVHAVGAGGVKLVIVGAACVSVWVGTGCRVDRGEGDVCLQDVRKERGVHKVFKGRDRHARSGVPRRALNVSLFD
jgi:hypothetical protein